MRFRARDGGTERRDAVVAASWIVLSDRARTCPRLLNQALLEQPLNRAVQRPWAEAQRAVRPRLDVLNDPIAVTVAPAQGQEDVEFCALQRQQGVNLIGLVAIVGRHRRTIVHYGYTVN